MTEKEFLKQVWRPFDMVTLDGGLKGRVVNVCFPTRSVRIKMPEGQPEWFRCEMIQEHRCITGNPDDASIIEELYSKLNEANDRISSLKQENAQLISKIGNNYVADILKNLNIIATLIEHKKKRVERMEACMSDITEIIGKMREEG